VIGRLVAGILIAAGLLWAALVVVQPGAGQALEFTGYVLAFNFVPGLAIMLVAGQRRLTPEVMLVGWVSGVMFNIAVVTVFWLAGTLGLLVLLPVLGAAGFLALLRHAPLAAPRLGPVLLAAVFLCATAVLSLAQILAGDPADVLSFHAAFQAVIVRGLEQGWPPPNLMLPDVPWAYNYAAHLWVLGASRMTGLPLDLLVTRQAPLLLCVTAAASLLAAGRILLGVPWWIAAIPVLSLFWVAGVPPITTGLFAIFMPFGANLILSPYVGMMFFLGTLLVLASDRPHGWHRFAVLGGVVFLATAARGVVSPLLICAAGLHAALVWYSARRIPWREGADVLALVLGFAAALVVFFGVGAGFWGTGFVEVTGQPFTFLVRADQYLFTLPHWLMRQGLPPLLAAILAFLVIAAFHGGLLTPALPAAFRTPDATSRRVVTLLSGGAIAGICAFFATEAPGYSHVSFLYYSGACLALLGARGLHHLLLHRPIRPLGWVGLAAILALCTIRVAELPGSATHWLAWRAQQMAQSFAGGGDQSGLTPVACHREEDGVLLQHLDLSSRPVVIFLPRSQTMMALCQALWLIVGTPLQTMNSYALTYVPGTGEEGLARLLAFRKEAMMRALEQAATGRLSVVDIHRLRDSLSSSRPTFVLADASLVPDSDGVELVVGNDRFRLWRVASAP